MTLKFPAVPKSPAHGGTGSAAMPVSSSSSLSRSALTLLTGNAGVVVLQALQFVMLARLLGASEFGRTAAVSALLAIFIPIADLGFGNLLQMRCAQQPARAKVEYGSTLGVTLAVGGAIGILLVPFAHWLYNGLVSPVLVLSLALAELVCFRSAWVSGQLFASREQFRMTSVFAALPAACKVVSLAVLLIPGTNASTWGVAVLLTSLLVCAYAVRAGLQLSEGASFDFGNVRRSWRDAIHFAIGTSARGAYTDADKVILARVGGAGEVGAYTSAYRVITMSFMPVRSLLQASAPRFFKRGADEGLRGTLSMSRRILMFSVPYAVVTGLLLYCLAPLLPQLLGKSFGGAIDMLRALVFLPVVQAVQYALSDALTGAGYQKQRTRLQLFTVAVYVAIGVLVIPNLGWRGAVITCYVGEGLLAVSIGVLMWALLRREKNQTQ